MAYIFWHSPPGRLGKRGRRLNNGNAMARILLLYSTTDGHTLTISRRLGAIIAAQGHEVELLAIEAADDADCACFGMIVVGARIRYGHHSRRVLDFVRRHRAVLESRPCGFFSVCVVARKPGKDTPETNPYLKKFLRRAAWQPRYQAVFAGRIDYRRYGPLDRAIIRFIMWLTHGPTDPTTAVEFTNWQAVEDFGRRIAAGAESDASL